MSVATAAVANESEAAAPTVDHQLTVRLAHSTSTSGTISNVSNAKSLYRALAKVFQLDVDKIAFCTINSSKSDMEKLLTGRMYLSDVLFVHCLSGAQRTFSFLKTEFSLGVTIADNGSGKVFIKRIHPESFLMQLMDVDLEAGDVILEVNGVSCAGKRHDDVANLVSSVAVGKLLTLKVERIFGTRPFAVSPAISRAIRSSNAVSSPGPDRAYNRAISSPSSANADVAIGVGSPKTAVKAEQRKRILAGNASESPDSRNIAIERMADLLESFLGARDLELAEAIVTLCKQTKTGAEFVSLFKSEFDDFGFPDDLVWDIWQLVRSGLGVFYA